MDYSILLNGIPKGLREPLLQEFNEITKNYLEKRWNSSELSGGKFSEIVFSILDGYAKGTFASKPFKPANFVDACRALEKNTTVPRSFQILIPRMLPALYEVRNNRSVGHVGGDVDPNLMDAQVVVSMCSWILGELIRVFHNVSTAQAQLAVDFVTNRKIPIVWELDDVKRVLKTNMLLKDQILLLVATSPDKTNTDSLLNWIEYPNKGYFLKSLRKLHKERLVELSPDESTVRLLPPGSQSVEKIIAGFI